MADLDLGTYATVSVSNLTVIACQVRNSTTILTKEYIDGLPNGWHNYAWRRINKGHRFHNLFQFPQSISA